MKRTDLKSVIFCSGAAKPRLQKNHEIPAHTTKVELVTAYGIDFTFDYAIPNDWACIAQDLGGDNNGWWSVIWAYDEKSGGWGRPFPLTIEALEIIKKTNEKLGWSVPNNSDFDFFTID